MLNFGDISDFARQPELGRGRIRDFWGGVYKRFLVRGPSQLTVEINRNHSFNTILPAVMLDLVDENPPPYTGTPEQRLLWRNTQRRLLLTQWQSKKTASHYSPAATEAQAVGKLFDTLQGLQLINGTWWATNGRQFYHPILRWYMRQAQASAKPDRSLLLNSGTCCYQLGMYDLWEQHQRKAGLTPSRDIEKALRFDGNNGFGHGFEAVSAYVANRSTATKQGGMSQPAPIYQLGTIESGGR